MVSKCVHKGCGKTFESEEEECVYHPEPPIFHEGQKGWKCCKPRVLTFDEFLSIPPCTRGKHSAVDDSPAPPPQTKAADVPAPTPVKPSLGNVIQDDVGPTPRVPIIVPPHHQAPQAHAKPPPPPDSESDDPALPVPPNTTCRRRGCSKSSSGSGEDECVHHPGQALFHEGSKGWTCCKRRVLEFDEFMRIEGCRKKPRHLFIGSGKKPGEEIVATVKHDFYQTPITVIASLFLKKIVKESAKIAFSANSVSLDLRTSDNKRYESEIPLFGAIDTDKSTYKIMGTKLEMTLVKADRTSWPVLRSDEPVTEIIQVGQAGRA